MNLFGRGPPAFWSPRTKKRGRRDREAADGPSRQPGWGAAAAQSEGRASSATAGTRGPQGPSPSPLPWGPPTDDARARASPQALCARSRPRRRLKTPQPPPPRARRGHANEPTVSAAPRRRTPPRSPGAWAQAVAAPACAGALPVPSGRTRLRNIFLPEAVTTENSPEKAAETPPLRTYWLSWLYLRSRSP